MPGRLVVLAAAWLAAAATAAAVSWTAVFVLGGGSVLHQGETTLTRHDVAKALASAITTGGPAAPALTGAPSPTAGTASTPPASAGEPDSPASGPGSTTTAPGPGAASTGPIVQTIAGSGGTAAVRCAGAVPVFVYLVPRPGYEVHSDGEPVGEAHFENGVHRTDITVSCVSGEPRVEVRERSES